MKRRNPPVGYFYLDALCPILRHNSDYISTMAENGEFQTAKFWNYEVPRPDGERRAYYFWIISCEEFLQLAQSVASPVPKFRVHINIVAGSWESEADAEKEASRIREIMNHTFSYGDDQSIDITVKEHTDGE